MVKVKIFGAGSIGNHLANASRQSGWEVTLCDIDPAALERARNEIYPGRYGAWDDSINLVLNDEAPVSGFDYIFVGTPPDSHIALARQAIAEKPKAVLVEKPFATPDLEGCQELYDQAREAGTRVFVGYDHAVAHGVAEAVELGGSKIGDLKTIDVAFREHWQGIFDAHPWLSGPADTYLGFWRRGGGALGEHSHALHMWQMIAHALGAGKVVKVSATLDYVELDGANYDQLACLNLETETGLIGRVVQDVVTRPVLKWACIQGANGAVEWSCRPSPYSDRIVLNVGDTCDEKIIDKIRPDDFIHELAHIEQVVDTGATSPISMERGLETMLVIAAAHRAAQEKHEIAIDYSRGYVSEALSQG